MRSLSLLLALSLAPAGEAATVFRCEDASGHVTFTQLGCPNAQAGERIEADNPPPGGTSVTPMATPAPLRREAPSVVVVGEGKEKCGARLGEQERRKAIVEQRIMAGMTRSDVERALGKPDRVSGNNAEVTYRYKADKRRGSRSVSFDQEGCVKGKAKSGWDSDRKKRSSR